MREAAAVAGGGLGGRTRQGIGFHDHRRHQRRHILLLHSCAPSRASSSPISCVLLFLLIPLPLLSPPPIPLHFPSLIPLVHLPSLPYPAGSNSGLERERRLPWSRRHGRAEAEPALGASASLGRHRRFMEGPSILTVPSQIRLRLPTDASVSLLLPKMLVLLLHGEIGSEWCYFVIDITFFLLWSLQLIFAALRHQGNTLDYPTGGVKGNTYKLFALMNLC